MTKTEKDSATSTRDDSERSSDVSDSLPAGSKNDGLLTRAEAAARIGISVTELRRREADGRIRPRKRSENGWHLFTVADVDAQANGARTALSRKSLAAEDPYTPAEVAKVFDALDEGKSLVQCVKECMVLPATVELIATAYARLTGAMFLSKATMDTINVLPLEGTFPLKGEAELLAVLQAASADTCKTCSNRARVLCKPCALKLTAKVERNAL